MHPLVRSTVLVGLVVLVMSACGGEARKNRGMSGAGAGSGNTEAGAGPAGEGGHAGTDGPARGGGANATAGEGGAQGTPSTGGASGGSTGSGGRDAVSGGAPSAGADGMSDAGEPSSPELPPRCEAVRQLERSGECEYEFTCDKETHFAGCQLESDGVWRCHCGTFSTATRYFELEGVAGLDACVATARVCVSDVVPDETRTCRRGPANDSASCPTHAICGYDLDLELGPGITARAVEFYVVDCEPDWDAGAEGPFLCSCWGGALDRETYRVIGPSMEGVCDSMLDLCVDEEPPVFPDRETCRDLSADYSEDGCMVRNDCQLAVEIGGGASITRSWSRSVFCEPPATPNDMPRCQCFDDGSYFVFESSLTPSEPGACEPKLELCSPSAAIEPYGEVTCKTSIRDPLDYSCSAEMVCRQSADANGTEIVAYGSLGVWCQQSMDRSWWCSCASGDASARFELGMTASSLAACELAEARCQEEVDVVFGLQGHPMPPSPLPE